MKRILLALVAGALSLSAQTPATGIKGTMHDLSVSGANGGVTNYTQICKFCHSPHGAAPAALQVIPLWGHMTTAATYTMYNTTNNPNSMMNPLTIVDAAPSGPSMACLSCHDGTVAVNARMAGGYSVSYGSMNASATSAGDFSITSGGTGAGAYTLGTLTKHIVGTLSGTNVDLTTVHPIAVTYDNVKQPALWAAPKAPAEIFQGKVQCASCHDVHNWSPDGGTTGLFLRDTTVGSKLCLDCHNK